MTPSPSQDGGPATAVAVLAGGASRRMGRAKATVDLGGRPLISYSVGVALAAGLEPFVVAKADSPLPELNAPRIDEPAEPRHPLTGIVAALEHAESPIVVLACDTPLVPPELVAALASCDEPFAMPDQPQPQPLIARYSPSLLPRLRAARDAGDSMTAVAESLGGTRFGEPELRGFGDPELIFSNVNEPADVARIEALLKDR